jgi:hypothetical protein
MTSAAQAAGDPAFFIDGARLRAGRLLRRPHFALGLWFQSGRAPSLFFLRVRLRGPFRGLWQAALWAWYDSGGVGDDVEIVECGLHGGSSFC